jgi:2-keto-4-pentenoate hydratase/2-oxohepta-3-ene-1,7-dioic acid hydratase in catechol pathway
MIRLKFVRFTQGSDKEVLSGVLTDEGIQEIQGDLFGQWNYTDSLFSPNAIQFVAPLQPNQIIGIGANYVAKKEDRPENLPEIPVFFFKPTSSVIGPEDAIAIPKGIEEVKFESELAVVIGKQAREVAEEDVLDYIFGYTIANDVTAPQYFHKDGHWMVGKSFDSFTPLGPVIETDLDPFGARVEAYHNGMKKQDSPTDLMIVPIRRMISYLSHVMTLQPGDVILTGSPLGAEFLGEGDVIECKINEIGTLRNSVVKAGKHGQR